MKLFWKLYLGHTALVLITVLVLGGILTRRLERDLLDRTGQELEGQAALLGEVARPGLGERADLVELQRAVQSLGTRVPTRLTVIRADGKVLADSRHDPGSMNDHSSRPEVVEAIRTGAPSTATRTSDTLGVRMMYTAAPILHEGRLLGCVRASLPLTDVEARLEILRRTLFLGGTVAALAALLPGFLLARRVTEPLVSMTEAARAIASGEQSFPLPRPSGRDEVGELSRAFALMGEQLRERLQIIETDRIKLLAILSSMVEGVVAVDREGRVVHLNEVAARLLAADPVRAIGGPIEQVTRNQQVVEAFSRTLHAAEITRRELTLPGEPREQTIQVQASPLRDAEGVAGAVMVLHDVTALRRLETLRREFVANVSHELKTPLTAIGGLVETLQDDPSMPGETQRRFLEKIRNQSERLTNLVADLLTLSRVESEEEALDMRLLDLRDPARESARGPWHDQEEKGLTLTVDLPDHPILVRGDHEALRQVFDNLLSNALKYTPQGGRIWLRLREEAGSALLEVRDTGIGLAPQDQERIFERFYRVDKARSRELGGTGLGLSIVKHVVLAHRGGVSVESQPQQGSTFRVRLPLATSELGSGRTEVAPA